MKIQFKILVAILAIVFSASCKPKPGSGGGGGGGSVPTAQEVSDYIDRLTTPKIEVCGDVIIDRQKTRKYPIVLPSGNNMWKDNYSEAISAQFDKDYMAPLRQQKIDEGDLSLIGCKGYNYATDSEKKQFWILFLAAVSKPESNFNPNEEFREADGSTSTGLLQIDPASSNRWCGILSKEKSKSSFNMSDMHDPKTNLQCGLLMMQWQVMGVPMGPQMKQTRPDLKGRLFTGNTFWYWSTLSTRNDKGQSDVLRMFKNHAQKQFEFCNRPNPIDGYTPGLSSKYKDIDCKEVSRASERLNCEKYLLNIKIENDMYNPFLGENPSDESCRAIDNTSRANTKTTAPKAEEIDQLPIENIGK